MGRDTTTQQGPAALAISTRVLRPLAMARLLFGAGTDLMDSLVAAEMQDDSETRTEMDVIAEALKQIRDRAARQALSDWAQAEEAFYKGIAADNLERGTLPGREAWVAEQVERAEGKLAAALVALVYPPEKPKQETPGDVLNRLFCERKRVDGFQQQQTFRSGQLLPNPQLWDGLTPYCGVVR